MKISESRSGGGGGAIVSNPMAKLKNGGGAGASFVTPVTRSLLDTKVTNPGGHAVGGGGSGPKITNPGGHTIGSGIKIADPGGHAKLATDVRPTIEEMMKATAGQNQAKVAVAYHPANMPPLTTISAKITDPGGHGTSAKIINPGGHSSIAKEQGKIADAVINNNPAPQMPITEIAKSMEGGQPANLSPITEIRAKIADPGGHGSKEEKSSGVNPYIDKPAVTNAIAPIIQGMQAGGLFDDVWSKEQPYNEAVDNSENKRFAEAILAEGGINSGLLVRELGKTSNDNFFYLMDLHDKLAQQIPNTLFALGTQATGF